MEIIIIGIAFIAGAIVGAYLMRRADIATLRALGRERFLTG